MRPGSARALQMLRNKQLENPWKARQHPAVILIAATQKPRGVRNFGTLSAYARFASIAGMLPPPPPAARSTNGQRVMRLLALLILIIGSLGAQRALAEPAFTQPLTRTDCVAAGMNWDESANVCAVEAVSGQPLTRADCDQAGLTWNEHANVCASESELAEGISPAEPALVITIDKDTQRMTVSLDGVQRYEWPVSTGQPGYATPSGTYTARSMNKIWYSRQWDNAPMPHAVFFTREGHAIHGTTEVKHLGNPASHGCVRLAPKNAETLYGLVADTGLENTQVILAGLTPGGDGRWASQTSSSRARSAYRVESYEPRRKRGGLFRRLFGRR